MDRGQVAPLFFIYSQFAGLPVTLDRVVDKSWVFGMMDALGVASICARSFSSNRGVLSVSKLGALTLVVFHGDIIDLTIFEGHGVDFSSTDVNS